MDDDDPEEREPKPKRRVGTRLPEDWQPSTEDLIWAQAKGHDQVLNLADFTEAFRDYWLSTTKNPTKLDWSRTWRNRLREEVERKTPRRRSVASRLTALPPLEDPALEALIAKKLAEEEEEARLARERAAGI